MRTACLSLIALLAATGCPKSKEGQPDEAKSEPTGPPQITEPKSAAPPCPDANALTGQLATLWKLDDNQRVVLIACVPGTFPEPGWFAMAWVDIGEDPDFPEESQLRQDIITNGRLITGVEATDVAPAERNEGLTFSDFSVHDFDGDGAQEIVFHERLEYREVMSSSYTVLWRRGSKIEQAFSVPLEREVSNEAWIDDEQGDKVASVSCEAEVKIDGGKLVVTGKVKTEGDPKELAVDAEGCVDGTITFVLSDGKFVAEAN